MNTPTDGYLAEFSVALRTPPGARRRALAEVAAHLDDAREALVAAGLTPAEAERVAVQRFGSAGLIATSFNTRVSVYTVLLDLYLRIAALVGLAVLAFGASNVLSAPLAWAFGATFVAGAPDGLGVPLDGCPALARAYPGAADCAAAWAQRSVQGSIGGGVLLTLLGGAVLGLHLLARRRFVGRATRERPRRIFRALTLGGFALVGAVLLGGGLMQTLTTPSSGDHRWLLLVLTCAAVVAAQLAGRTPVALRGDG